MIKRHLILPLLLCISTCLNAAEVICVPYPDGKAIDQTSVHNNGCGPISQLNAYAFSSVKWRGSAASKIPGNTAQKRFEYLTKRYGRKFSRHIHAHLRWNDKTGINALDLLDFINDFHKQARLPKLKLESFFLKDSEDHHDLLQRTHRTLKQSLESGLPPILDLRRFAKKRAGGGFHWRGVHGHFVVVYEIPSKLNRDATTMTIKYIDPWGGKIRTGTLQSPKGNFFANDINKRSGRKMQKTPCLEANFPGCSVGRHLLRTGEENVLILSAALGSF